MSADRCSTFIQKCIRCGASYDAGEDGFYETCGCKMWAAGEHGLKGPAIIPHPLCDWCGARGVKHNLDGENLCLPCCNKWARGEGIAALEQTGEAR